VYAQEEAEQDRRSAAAAAREAAKKEEDEAFDLAAAVQVLCLLALVAQKYKYWRRS
jgi:hypothetical protein